MHDFGPCALAAFEMKWRTIARGGIEPPPLPAGIGIIDASIHALGVKSQRIRHPEIDEFSIDECEKRLIGVPCRDRHIRAEPQGVVLVNPGVVARFGRARRTHIGDLWPRKWIKRPSLGAMRAGG